MKLLLRVILTAMHDGISGIAGGITQMLSENRRREMLKVCIMFISLSNKEQSNNPLFFFKKPKQTVPH